MHRQYIIFSVPLHVVIKCNRETATYKTKTFIQYSMPYWIVSRFAVAIYDFHHIRFWSEDSLEYSNKCHSLEKRIITTQPHFREVAKILYEAHK
jgi:hypothetical protein